jgi:hypothetical protein
MQKAKVNVVMFGRATEVELDYVQIKKVAPVVTAEPVAEAEVKEEPKTEEAVDGE